MTILRNFLRDSVDISLPGGLFHNPQTHVTYAVNAVRDAGVPMLYRSVQVGLPKVPFVEQSGSANVMQLELL